MTMTHVCDPMMALGPGDVLAEREGPLRVKILKLQKKFLWTQNTENGGKGSRLSKNRSSPSTGPG